MYLGPRALAAVVSAGLGFGLGVALVVTAPSSVSAASNNDCALDFAALLHPDPKTGPRNSQLAIWTLESRGNAEAAARLKSETTKALQKAKIVDAREISDEDFAAVAFLEFEGGLRGIWKTSDIDSDDLPFREIQKEITAYKFDQMIGAGIVPITVPRSYKGRPGVVQLFVRNADRTELTHSPSTLKLFDFLVAHRDRTELNQLTHRGRTVAIDNESTFSAGPLSPVVPQFDTFIADVLKKVEALGSTEAAKNVAIAEISPSLISKTVVDNLRKISDAEWKRGLTGLDKDELSAFLERKNRAIKAIDLAIDRLGPEIFPSARFSGLSRNIWVSDREYLRAIGPKLPVGNLKADALKAQRILEAHGTTGRPLTNEQIDFVDRVLTDVERAAAPLGIAPGSQADPK